MTITQRMASPISCEVHNLSVGHLDNICYGLAYYGFNASANDSKC